MRRYPNLNCREASDWMDNESQVAGVLVGYLPSMVEEPGYEDSDLFFDLINNQSGPVDLIIRNSMRLKLEHDS